MFMIVFAIGFSGLMLSLITVSFKVIFVILILSIWLLFVGFYFVIKRNGFGKNRISPYIYACNKDFKIILKNTEEFVERFGMVNEENAWGCFNKNHLYVRILLMHIEHISKDEFKKRKDFLNKTINRETGYKNYTSFATATKHTRINIVVVESMNDYCYDIVNRNAVLLFSRAEGVLNIILSQNEKKVFIPSHFGINGIFQYNKTAKVAKKIILG